MNSKHRRNQRVYEHEVTLVCHNGERYFEFDRKLKQAKMWLQWRTKRKNYVVGPEQFDRRTFKFSNAGLATMFALRWS